MQAKVSTACNPQGLLGKSYSAILNWSLPVLDLDAHERVHAMNQSQLLPVLNKRSRAPRGSSAENASNDA